MLQLEHDFGSLTAILQRFQPEIRQSGSLRIVHVHFISGHTFFLVRVGIRNPHAGAKFIFYAAHGFQDIRSNEVLHKVLGESFKDQAVIAVFVIDRQAFAGHDLIVDLFDCLRHALAIGTDEITQFAVLDIDLCRFRVQGQLIRVIIHQIQDPTIVRLQPDDLTLGAYLRLQNAAQVRINNDGMGGLVKDIIASQAALLRDRTEFISIDNCQISPTVQDIFEIILRPGFRQRPFKHGDCPLQKISAEIRGHGIVAAMYGAG